MYGDITAAAHANIRKLGLQPSTVTGKEIYQALQARVAEDNKRLAGIIGVNDSDDIEVITPKIIEAANKMPFSRKVFTLKPEKAKELLREMPPKKLMAALGYSDVDTMLENEDVDELYVALRFAEGDAWLENFNQQFIGIPADDFASRDLRVMQLDTQKYTKLAKDYVVKHRHNVTHSKEFGVVAVVPVETKKMKGFTLKTLSLVFHYMNEVHMYSTFFKLKRQKPYFGTIVAETLIADPGTSARVAGNKIHWRVIQKYYSYNPGDEHESVAFEPHVHPDDLHWQRAEEMLIDLDPQLKFWQGLDYVGLNHDGRPLSFNLFDVSFGYANQIPYEDRYVRYFRESLWNEIFARYMGHKNLRDQVLEQLDNDAIEPEMLKLPKTPVKKVDQEAVLRQQKNLLLRQRAIDDAEGRISGAFQDMDEVFEALGKYEKTVTIFGSARESVGDAVLDDVYKLSKLLASEGYAVVTGGGHGVMSAANRGAYEVGGDSIGLNILLPKEQTLNSYTTENYEFNHFFGRKVSLTLMASAYIYAPGGFGTLDELFEIITLKQTHRIPPIPVILLGSKFWNKLDDFIKETLRDEYKTIEAADRKTYEILDNHKTILKRIDDYTNEQLNKR